MERRPIIVRQCSIMQTGGTFGTMWTPGQGRFPWHIAILGIPSSRSHGIGSLGSAIGSLSSFMRPYYLLAVSPGSRVARPVGLTRDHCIHMGPNYNLLLEPAFEGIPTPPWPGRLVFVIISWPFPTAPSGVERCLNRHGRQQARPHHNSVSNRGGVLQQSKVLANFGHDKSYYRSLPQTDVKRLRSLLY